jgi:hypothetical protein
MPKFTQLGAKSVQLGVKSVRLGVKSVQLDAKLFVTCAKSIRLDAKSIQLDAKSVRLDAKVGVKRVNISENQDFQSHQGAQTSKDSPPLTLQTFEVTANCRCLLLTETYFFKSLIVFIGSFEEKI